MKTIKKRIIAVVITLVFLAWSGVARGGDIHDAAAAGDMAKVKTLLTGNPDLINAREKDGWTPLRGAVYESNAIATKKEYYNTGADEADGAGGTDLLGQTFTTTSAYTLGSVKLKLWVTNPNPGTITVSIRATSSNLPTGGDLCIGTINGDDITTDTAGEWHEISFGAGTALSNNTKYAIVVSAPGGHYADCVVLLIADGSSPAYSGGSMISYYNGSWHVSVGSGEGIDAYFECCELKEPTAINYVYLLNGDRISGTVIGLDRDTLFLDCMLSKKLRIDMRAVTAVDFQPKTHQKFQPRKEEMDKIDFINGDKITGDVLSISEKTITIEGEYGKLALKKEGFSRIVFGLREKLDLGFPKEEKNIAILKMVNGDIIRGKLFNFSDDVFHFTTKYSQDLKIESQYVSSLTFTRRPEAGDASLPNPPNRKTRLTNCPNSVNKIRISKFPPRQYHFFIRFF